MKNIYDGVATTVGRMATRASKLPEWFEALNRELPLPAHGDRTRRPRPSSSSAKVVREVAGESVPDPHQRARDASLLAGHGYPQGPFRGVRTAYRSRKTTGSERGTYLHPHGAGKAKETGLDYKRSLIREP
jgi:hypothetical protein